MWAQIKTTITDITITKLVQISSFTEAVATQLTKNSSDTNTTQEASESTEQKEEEPKKEEQP